MKEKEKTTNLESHPQKIVFKSWRQNKDVFIQNVWENSSPTDVTRHNKAKFGGEGKERKHENTWSNEEHQKW